MMCSPALMCMMLQQRLLFPDEKGGRADERTDTGQRTDSDSSCDKTSTEQQVPGMGDGMGAERIIDFSHQLYQNIVTS